MGEEGLEWRIHALSQDVCDLLSDLFCPWDKRKLRAFDGRKVFCVVPRFAPNSYAKTRGEIRWQDSSRTSGRGGLQLVPKPPGLSEASNARKPPESSDSGGQFHGCQPAEALSARLLRGDALRPLAKEGCWMPACQSEKSVFIAFFSRTGVLGRAMQPPGRHPAFLPSASQSHRWKQRATD